MKHVWIDKGTHLECSECFKKTSVDDNRGLRGTECKGVDVCDDCAEMGWTYCIERDLY